MRVYETSSKDRNVNYNKCCKIFKVCPTILKSYALKLEQTQIKYNLRHYTNLLCVCNLEPESLSSFYHRAFYLKYKRNSTQ